VSSSLLPERVPVETKTNVDLGSEKVVTACLLWLAMRVESNGKAREYA
jgi:hypothetical protein